MQVWLTIAVLLWAALTGVPQPDVYTAVSVTDSAASVARYPDFAAVSAPGVLIPGLTEGFVPQGITWLEPQRWFVFAGYHTDGRASALIAVDADSGAVRRQVSLRNIDGTPYTGHAGGVCATATALYLSNQHRLFRLPLDRFLGAAPGAACAFDAEIPVPNNASYCSCQDGMLWVGEFRHGSNYTTDPAHHLRLNGETLGAWLCGYRLTPAGEGPAAGARPDVILATPDRVQGMTALNGRVWLSLSYGRGNSSTLQVYADPRLSEPDMTVDIDGTAVPVWCLLNSRQTDRIIAPPMTECLCAADGAVWVVFESAAVPYMDPVNTSRCPVDRLYRVSLPASDSP